jgi:hypothetical protein
MKCSTCRKELREGKNVIEVQEGIIGTSGFVSLGKTGTFCDVECLKEFFKAVKGYDQAPRRVP